MKITRIDLNSWIFHIAGQTILVDPWLVDPLVFYGQPWLFTAYHNTPVAFTPSTLPPIDLILISQGLDDHCHRPTLELLVKRSYPEGNRTIPAIASPTAAKVLSSLGYTNITSLANWQEFNYQEKLQITAVPGAEIGPGQEENGYLLKDLSSGETLYYEPHLPPLEKVKHKIDTVDVAIAPVIGQIFPFLGQVIIGPSEALKLAQTLKPRFFLPTATGDIRATGILPMLVRSIGSIPEFRDLLAKSGLSTQLLEPEPGQTLEILDFRF
ncbi:MBL fold metallo-hydrolase [Microcoleus sp. T3B2]|uniref:MBL fold metallo-hydrolase n=1 Tax=Microcoleus sp. T3B2 TaxID=3055426 RepID=UPI002FD035C1